MRAFIKEVVQNKRLPDYTLLDITKDRILCEDCGYQVGSYIQFTSLTLAIDNIAFPRSYAIYFNVTESAIVSTVKSNFISVASTSPILVIKTQPDSSFTAPAELTTDRDLEINVIVATTEDLEDRHKIADGSIVTISLFDEDNARPSLSQFDVQSTTTEILRQGSAAFKNLHISKAGQYRLTFAASPVKMRTAPNYYFSSLENFLTLSAQSAVFEIKPAALSKVVVVQQPQDENAMVGCIFDLACPHPHAFSYMPLYPYPSASPTDAWGNGIGGIIVRADMTNTKSFLESNSDGYATSSHWKDGGVAIFDDITVVPQGVNLVHQIIFTAEDRSGNSASAISLEFTAGYLNMSLDGHQNLIRQIAGQTLPVVTFNAVDHMGVPVESVKSKVTATTFTTEGLQFGDAVVKYPDSSGKVDFSDIRISRRGAYYVTFTYLDMMSNSSRFDITSGNPVALNMDRQPNNVHKNQYMVPAPVVIMIDAFGNTATSQEGKIIHVYTVDDLTNGDSSVELSINGTICTRSLPCSVATNAASAFVVNRLAVLSTTPMLRLVFSDALENMQRVESSAFSVTIAEPHLLTSTMQQSTLRVGEWLDEMSVLATDIDTNPITAVDAGTLQDGGLDFVVLAQSARSDNDYYTNMMLVLTTGPGAGQQAQISAFHGSTRLATVSLHRKPTSTSKYEIRYVATLRVVSFNGIAVNWSSADTVFTDAIPAISVRVFVGPDEAVLENEKADFVGIWMQRAGEYKVQMSINTPSYLNVRVSYTSGTFVVRPGDPAGFYISPFFGKEMDDSPMFSADDFVPSFFAHMKDGYGNNIKDGVSTRTEFRLQATGGIFAPRAPGFEVQKTNSPFAVIEESSTILSTTVVVAIDGMAVFGGLKVETTGRGFSFLISADLYAPVATLQFSIFPGVAKRIMVLRQPLDFKLDAVSFGTIPSQPRICVLDSHDNSLVVQVRVDLRKGDAMCGTLESLQAQGVEDKFNSDYTCTVDLSSNPNVDSREGIDDGTAEFTDLAVTQAGEGYFLQFEAIDMRTMVKLDQLFFSEPFTVIVGDPFRFRLKNADVRSFCPRFPGECQTAGRLLPSFQMIIVDAYDNQVPHKSFKSLRCEVQVPFFLDTGAYKIIAGQNIYIPVLSGTTIVPVSEGVANFTDLVIQQVSYYAGENQDPVVKPGSWVLEFKEPAPAEGLPSIFPGNTFTSEPFKIVAGKFHALGINGFESNQVFVSTEIPLLKVSGIDKYGNFVGGSEGVVRVELSGVDESVILFGKAPVDPVNELLLDFHMRELVDGLATFDGLMIKIPVNAAVLTFWIFNEVDETKREPQVVLGPFEINALGMLRVTEDPSSLSDAGSSLTPAPAVEIISTLSGSKGQLVAATATVQVHLYNHDAAVGLEWNTQLWNGSQVTLDIPISMETEKGVAIFTNLVIQKAGNYSLAFQLVYLSGDTSDISFSEWFRVGPAMGGSCTTTKPCKIMIVNQPPAELIVNNYFQVEALIQDFYANPIDTGVASISILDNPSADPLLGSVNSIQIRPNGHVTFSGLHTFRSCNPGWCQGHPSMTGYTLVVRKGSQHKETDVVSVNSEPVVVKYSFSVTTTQVIVAGKQMDIPPQVIMQDSFDNLVVTSLPPRRWVLEYTGTGCLPCRYNAPCGKEEGSSKNISFSKCMGAAKVVLGILSIGVEAPTIIGANFQFKIEVLTWDGTPLHPAIGLLTSNQFDVEHTDTDFIQILRDPFPHLFAGLPFWIELEMFDLYGNAVTSGVLEASLLGPDNIEFDLANCSYCSTSLTVVKEGGSKTNVSLQITQMQMDMQLEIVLTHLGTGVPCTDSPLEDVPEPQMCINPFTIVPGRCPKKVIVNTRVFRIINAPPHKIQMMPLPGLMGAGTAHQVEIHILDRYNNLVLDLREKSLVTFSVASKTLGYAGLFPQLEPDLLTTGGAPATTLTCNCASINKGVVQVQFPAPLTVANNLELEFSIAASLQGTTYLKQDMNFIFSTLSNKINILPGNARSISIALDEITDFNRFGFPLHRQPCMSITDSESNPVAPELEVEAHICAANGTMLCELAGFAETDESDEVCFSNIVVKRPAEFILGFGHYYFKFFVSDDVSVKSPTFRVYDVTGLHIAVEPVRSLVQVAMSPAPEVWLCYGQIPPCSISSRVLEWPHVISVDLVADDGKLVQDSFLGAVIRGGSAKFTQLLLDIPGNGFKLSFALGNSDLTEVSAHSFSSVMSDHVLHLNITYLPSSVRAGQEFSISVALLDFFMQPLTPNGTVGIHISWADECSDCQGQLLLGNDLIATSVQQANFQGLKIQKTGHFNVKIWSPDTSGMMHASPDMTISRHISVLNSQSYRIHISQQPSSCEYRQIFPTLPILDMRDEFDNIAEDLNGRIVQAIAICQQDCSLVLTVSSNQATVMNGRVFFQDLLINYTSSASSSPPGKIRLKFTLCSTSGDCPTVALEYAMSQVLNMSMPTTPLPQDPFIRIDVQPRSTKIGSYSSSFRPEISVIDSQGQLDASKVYTIFMKLSPGQFLGSVALRARLQKVPKSGSKAVVVDELHAKIDTINGRAVFEGIVVTGSPGDDFSLTFTRCHVGSNLTASLTSNSREMCNWLDDTIGSNNLRTSHTFSVTNSEIFSMDILTVDYPAGQDFPGRLVTLSDRPLHFTVRVDDKDQFAIGSRSYVVTAQLMNASSGVAADAGILQGLTTSTSKIGLSTETAGEADFTNLRITKTGEGWYIRFFALPDCKYDAGAVSLCNDEFVLVNTVQKLSRPIDVGHDTPEHLEFVSQPRNVTSGYVVRGTPRPWIEVRVLDRHRNPVTCSGSSIPPTDPPTGTTLSESRVANLLKILLDVCNTGHLSPRGSFNVELSLLMSNGSATEMSGTTQALTHFSVATFSTLRPASPSARVSLVARLKVPPSLSTVLPGILKLEQKSHEFIIWATSYDFIETIGCPPSSKSYEAGARYAELAVSGVFAKAQPQPLRSSVEGTCSNGVGCLESDISAAMASVYVYGGIDPGKLECIDEELCLQMGGPRTIPFEDGQAFFRDFTFPPVTASALTVRLAIVSPFDGRLLHIDCQPVVVVSGSIAAIEVIKQPLTEASTGEAVPVQPFLRLVDRFGNKVLDNALGLGASVCLPCPCPCENAAHVLPSSIAYGLPCESGKASSWSPTGNIPAECAGGIPALDGNFQKNDQGIVRFRNLRVTYTGKMFVFLYSVNILPEVNTTSSPFNVGACSPHVLKMNALSQLSAVADTGVSFCTGGSSCILEVKDLFGNLIFDSPIEIEAFLDPSPSVSLAGFGVSSLCACTGTNTIHGVGAVGTSGSNTNIYNGFIDASYGIYCNSWDTYKVDCADIWPGCDPGLWCCRPWCYVSPSCPSAVPDTLVTGLFFSYQACSPDPDIFWKCPHKSDGSCAARNASTDWYEVESIFPPPSKLRGKSLTETVEGKVIFTDLHSTHPGKYRLTFKGYFGNQLLYWSETLGVTPLFARKLRIATPPNNKTTTGNPLAQQPSIVMLDQFENPVIFSEVCQAITASVVTWSGRQPYGTVGRSKDRYVYGQATQDNNLYPTQCDNDIQNDCIVTSNAQEGLAAFTWMHIGGGPSQGIVLNFTTGCCNSDPNLCYCSDPTDPSKVDDSRSTEPVREPCSYVTSDVFTLKMPVAGLAMQTNPHESYKSGERLHLAVSFQDAFGKKVAGGNDVVSASLYRRMVDGTHKLESLAGDTQVEADDGTSTFRNIFLEKLPGEYSNGIYGGNFSIVTMLVEFPEVEPIRSSYFTVQPDVPTVMLPWDENTATYKMPAVGFRYENLATSVQEPNVLIKFALFDRYGNLAPAPGATVAASVTGMDLAPGGEISQGVALEGNPTAHANNEQILCCQTSLQWTGEFNITFVTSLGVYTDLSFSVIPGPAERLYVSAGFSGVIIGWEPFFVKLEVVDMYGNLVPAHNGLEIRVSSIMQGLGNDPLNDDNSITKQISGCTSVSQDGYVYFESCRAKEVPADADSYPNARFVGELLFGGIKDEKSGDVFPTLRQSIEILPPAVQLWVTGCLTKDRCDAYNGTRECGCSKNFLGREQASKEPFFYFPRVELRDSKGHLSHLSTLKILASVVEPTPSCVGLFGNVALFAVAGVVEFKTTGVTYVENECAPYNWMTNVMRLGASHRDQDHMGVTTVSVLNIENVLVSTVVSEGYIESDFTFAITYPLTQLELAQAPEGGPWALTGLVLQPLLTVRLVYIFATGPGAGETFLVKQSSREIRVRIYRCTTPHWSNTCADDDQSPANVLIGNTTIISVDGYAVFTNISIVTVGTFYLEIDTITEADAVPLRVQLAAPFLPYVKITSGPLAQLRVLKTPDSWTVGELVKSLVVELLDQYENRLDCQYGECAVPLYGFPSLVGKRDWPLLPSSDLAVSVSLDHSRYDHFTAAMTDRDRVCGASSNFLATEGLCSCLGGSVSVTAIEGVALIDCLTVGMAGTSLPLTLSAGGKNHELAPFSVEPGIYSALYMIQQPPPDDTVAGGPVLYCPKGLGCFGLSVQAVDMCGNFLYFDGENEIDIEVSVCPTNAGLVGTVSSGTTVQGKATFTDLVITRAKNMPCEIADSVHYWDHEESLCMQRQTSYVFIFSAISISVASSEFLVDNGNMQAIEIVKQPGDSVQGSLLTVQPQVKLIDPYGNTVTVDSGGGFIVQAAMVTGQGCTRADQPVCSSNCDGTAIGGTCYKYFTDPSTFDQAVTQCENWGGELLTVTSAQTNLDIVAPLTGGALSWIGLKWEQGPQDWVWRDEQGSNTDDYTNWDQDYPPLIDQQVTGCVAAFASRWRTDSCNRRLPYVCGNDVSDEAQNECNCCSKLTGTSTVLVKGGFAAYTDLVIASEPGLGFQIVFSAMPVSQSFGANILCEGPCDCTPKAMVTRGVFDDGKGEYENSVTCKWMISTMATIPGGLRDPLYGEAEILLWFTSFDTEAEFDFVAVNECTSEACPDPVLIQQLDGSEAFNSGPTAVREGTVYSSPTGFLQLVFQTDTLKKNFQGFRAQWSVNKAPSDKIVAPPPPWQRAAGISEQFDIIPRTSSLFFFQEPSLSCAGQALVNQPHLLLIDSHGDRVEQEPITVSVSVISSSSQIQIVGTTTKISTMGHVVFTDLEITTATSKGVRLQFLAHSGTPPVPLFLQSKRFAVMPGAQHLKFDMNTQPITIIAGETLADLICRLYDKEMNLIFASNTAVGVTLVGAPVEISTPAGENFPPIIGMTEQTALNGSVTFDQLRISWATKSTRIIFSAPHIGLQAESQGYQICSLSCHFVSNIHVLPFSFLFHIISRMYDKYKGFCKSTFLMSCAC